MLFILSVFIIIMNVLGRTESLQLNSGLKNFLRNHVPSALSSFRNAALHPTMKYKVFIGNEAADADSIISSLVYSYFKYTQHITETSSFFIPVVSIIRSELHLRRDVKLLLNEVDIDLNDLVCIDDCNFMSGSAFAQHVGKLGAGVAESREEEEAVDTGNIEITLLDHNSLSSIAKEALVPPGAAIPRVVEILDHHVDAGQHKESCSGSVRNIAFDATTSKALVGSACTLVYEQITRQASYHDMHELDDVAFKQDSTSYLRAAFILDRLGFETSDYQEHIRAVKGRLDAHLPSRGSHQQMAFALYYEHFKLPFPAQIKASPSLIQSRKDPYTYTILDCLGPVNWFQNLKESKLKLDS